MAAFSKSAGWMAALLALFIITGDLADAQKRGKFKLLDVPFAGTPPAGVALMLRMAKVGPEDIVYDLGSGDGRIVIAAVRDFGAKSAVGIDIDPKRAIQGAQNAKKAGVAGKTSFIGADIFRSDFSEATVVTLFMSHRINRELRPIMVEQLKPGTRIVAFRFPVRGWKPVQIVTLDGDEIFLYVMPPRH
jgi:SAM-dependent methyltransferase